jgi:hypothetical protein
MGLGTVVSSSKIRIVQLAGGEPTGWAAGCVCPLKDTTTIAPGSLVAISYSGYQSYTITTGTILTPGSGTVQSQGSGSTAAVINISSLGNYVLNEDSAPSTLPLWQDPSPWKNGGDNVYTACTTSVSPGPQPPAPPIIFAFIYDPTGVMVAVDFMTQSS